MSGSLGARLRQHREERHVDLTTIADQTKIKLSLFEELERDDVSRWPSGIFRRAYIRAYAHAIGLDPDTVLREFLDAHPDPGEVVDPVIAAAAANDQASAGPPTRLRGIVSAAIGSLPWRQRSTPLSVASTGAIAPPAPAARQVPLPAPQDSIAAKPPAEPKPAIRVPQSAEVRGTCGKGDDAGTQEPSSDPADFTLLADLCTRLGRVADGGELAALLQDAADLLGAKGLVVWLWNGAELIPAVAHGYSEKVLAQLPGLRRDADNATAAAFRLGQPCAASGSDRANGALVVPLLSAAGCSGVLALELPHGSERREEVRGVATILAAMLAQLVGVDAAPRAESLPGRIAAS